MDLLQALQTEDIAAIRAAVEAEPAAAKFPRAIIAAAGRALLPAVQLLHRRGADLNAVWRNYRPIHNLMQTDPHAATEKPEPGRLACLEWMLANGADPELAGAWPAARALIIAAFVGQPEYVKCLRRAGARVDGFTGAALGDGKAVEKALGERPEFARERDTGGLTALQCAAGSRLPRAGVLPIAELLLDAGADPNTQTRTWGSTVNAAYFACGVKNAPMFELLLERGADATDAFGHAVWGKHYDLAERALAHSAQLDRAMAGGKPLLNDLIRWGQIPQAQWMLAHGASPNVPDGEGWTAAHQAASRGNATLLKAVLDAGADLTLRDKNNSTPLEVARARKRPKLVAMLAR